MDISPLVEELGRLCGSALDMPPGGAVALKFDGDVVVHLEHDAEDEYLHLYTVLGSEPADARASESIHRRLLVANLFGHHTGGAAIAIDPANGEILLTRRFELGQGRLDGDQVYAAIQGIAASADELEILIREGASSQSIDRTEPSTGAHSASTLLV